MNTVLNHRPAEEALAEATLATALKSDRWRGLPQRLHHTSGHTVLNKHEAFESASGIGRKTLCRFPEYESVITVRAGVLLKN